ncbi:MULTISPECIES: large conductance mechanosensitive channel protein MscL [Paenibacillus]|uniref:large conductance mechanosensitive channel protein MscL n=1 Tax=Paenibacillus TaxID=44249 RepID=UPI000373986E|nr:large conductance mechanosensitive channel protein MscL [Paenibacillus massiliensis]
MKRKGLLHEFKEFAVRGNVIDLAVGVIIGAAFGKIVTSIVNDILMPPIGKILGDTDFSNLYYPLDENHLNPDGSSMSLAQAQDAGVAVIAYGQFINVLLDFVIVAFCIFLLVKGINMLKRKEQDKPAPEKKTKECPYCLSEIPVKAVRCSQCTSQLEESVSS